MLEQLLRRCWGPPEGGPQREGSDTNRKLHLVASVILSRNHANLEPRPLHSAFISGAKRDTPFLSNSCTRSTKYQRISYSKIFTSLVGEPFQYKLTSRPNKKNKKHSDGRHDGLTNASISVFSTGVLHLVQEMSRYSDWSQRGNKMKCFPSMLTSVSFLYTGILVAMVTLSIFKGLPGHGLY